MKSAYRRQAKRHHPDLHPGPEAVARMAEINRAHELLSDAGRRAAWDAAHPAQVRRPATGPATSNRPGTAAGSAASGGPRESGGRGAARPDRGTSDTTLQAALAFVLTFGKYRGRTLGYVAAVEPGYIAWIVRAIDNRPDVTRHARVVLAHLEGQGWRDTPRRPRPRGAAAGAHTGAGRAGNGPRATGTGPRATGDGPHTPPRAAPSPTRGSPPRAAPRRRDAAQVLEEHAALVGLGLTGLGGVAWLAGIPPETVSTLAVIAAVIGWPIWSVIQDRRHQPAGQRRGFGAVRGAMAEVVFVAVLLLIGWGLLQSVLRGPQPGDIVCEVYDPRLGDCVVESVYEGS